MKAGAPLSISKKQLSRESSDLGPATSFLTRQSPSMKTVSEHSQIEKNEKSDSVTDSQIIAETSRPNPDTLRQPTTGNTSQSAFYKGKQATTKLYTPKHTKTVKQSTQPSQVCDNLIKGVPKQSLENLMKVAKLQE